jgi:glycosyltransferase involved in cell wall biosynthesis
MVTKNLPSISVLIPTLNAAKVLGSCLRSIANQDYPAEKIEIIIADGGSTDKTLEIAKRYRTKIYQNPLKTGEAGKAVALRQARGELVVLIDSDNILPEKNWLKKMVEPFSDPEIIGSEPWEFTYRKQDGFIDRYCALMGMNDPLCYFLGNYDRRNVLSGKWTGLPVKQEDKGDWLKITLKLGAIPTIGANGTILRKSHLRGVNVGDYLFDIDVIASLAAQKPVKFAKVKVGIIHLYCGSDVGKFIRKQTRRIRDYLYYQKIGARSYPWQKQNKAGLVKFVLACFTLLPLLYQTIKGYFKKPDSAWFFHPLACWLTLITYAQVSLLGKVTTVKMGRERWGQ